MSDAMHIAATGMQAQQLNVDTIANNLANVNTMGFKAARVSFTDLVSRQVATEAAGASRAEVSLPTLSGARLGSGVGVASVAKLFALGELKQTGAPLDLALRGDGFLEVELPDGTAAYSRGGTLHLDTDGRLGDAAGNLLRPGITVPSDATALTIEADGRVLITMPGQPRPVEAGQLELVKFTHPEGLAALGAGVFRASEASGEPIPGRAGSDGIGLLSQGHLEASNVRMVDEMVNLMVAQRAYEANVKVIQAADEMAGMVNSMRK